MPTTDDEHQAKRKELAETNPQKRLKTSSSDPIAIALAHARSKVALLVNPNQLRNPMVRYIRHVRKEPHNGISADFVCGPTTCALYLSLQFHRLHPDYVYKRVRALGTNFKLRILLVLVDVADHRASLHELTKMCLINNMTVVCAGSEREAARYLETLQCYDGKGADTIQERVANDYASKLNAALSSVRGINRTDVNTLAFTFGSFRGIAEAAREELRQCPGIGERKVARLFQALHQPFQGDWKEMDEDVQEDSEGEVP